MITGEIKTRIDQIWDTFWAELGSKEDYEKFTAGMSCGPNVAIFIRSLIGVDRKRAMLRFGDFISGASLNAEQEGLQTGTIKVFELCYLQEERMIAGCRTFSMTFSTTAGWNGRPTRLRPSM